MKLRLPKNCAICLEPPCASILWRRRSRNNANMTENETWYSLVQVLATTSGHDYDYRVCNLPQSSSAAAATATVVHVNRTAFATETTELMHAWKRKRKEHSVSRNFHRFLDSAAIELGVFSDLFMTYFQRLSTMSGVL